MQTTYGKIIEFLGVANLLRGDSKAPLTKFHYAIDKVKIRIEAACKKLEKFYSERQEDLRIKYASVDEKGNVSYKDGGYLFSKENTMALTEDSRKLLAEKYEEPVEFEPYISEHIPELNMGEIEYLSGFVIPENYEIPVPKN